MASLVLSGDTSGSITVSAPAVAGSTTQTLVNVTGTLAPIVSGTAQASTSGTSIDFTGIPSWVKRITVMFNGVSTSGTSNLQIQIGAGSVTTTGYSGYSQYFNGSTLTNLGSVTTGFPIATSTATDSKNGLYNISLLTSNTWVCFGGSNQSASQASMTTGSVSLGGTLDRVRITTVNGTDTFDAGTINLLWE